MPLVSLKTVCSPGRQLSLSVKIVEYESVRRLTMPAKAFLGCFFFFKNAINIIYNVMHMVLSSAVVHRDGRSHQ